MWYCNCDDCADSEPSSQCEVCVNFSNFKRKPELDKKSEEGLIEGTEPRLINANALCDVLEKGAYIQVYNSAGDAIGRKPMPPEFKQFIDAQPTIKAIPIKSGYWRECYRDDRCISVICSNCKQATVIAHGCFPGAAKVTYEDVVKRLPHCPKCCAEMSYSKSEKPL